MLLLITMRLFCLSLVGELGAAMSLYVQVKRCYHHLETTGILSTRMLQTCLLITYFELANAIYPAAYMGIGACSRQGYALGIHVRRCEVQMLPHSRVYPHTYCNSWSRNAH